MNYDDVPVEWYDDPKKIWQAQIKKEKYFEDCSFMGTLGDLSVDPDWREAFRGVEDCTGMSQFMDRLQGHFELCRPAKTSDGKFHLYQHPSRTHTSDDLDKDAMLALATAHIDTLIKGLERSGHHESADELSQISIQWTDEPINYFSLPWREQQVYTDAPIDIYSHEAWDFMYEDPYFTAQYRTGIPSIMSPLKEATYSMGNNYGLQRYLMEGFVTHGMDVVSQYELEWVHNCIFYFYDNICYVCKNPN